MCLLILIAVLVSALEIVKTLPYTIAHPQQSHGWLHPKQECIEEAFPRPFIKIDPKVWSCLLSLWGFAISNESKTIFSTNYVLTLVTYAFLDDRSKRTHKGKHLSSIGWDFCMHCALLTSVSRWLNQQRVCTSAIWIQSVFQTQLLFSSQTLPMSNLWKCPLQPCVFVCVCRPVCTVSLYMQLIGVD